MFEGRSADNSFVPMSDVVMCLLVVPGRIGQHPFSPRAPSGHRPNS